MHLLIRCDGGGTLGVGHAIRSLALAEEARSRGHAVTLAGHFEGDFVQRQLRAAGVATVHVDPVRADPAAALDELLALVGERAPDVVHVDSYELPDGLDRCPVLTSNVEDGSFGRRHADVCIDPTLGAEAQPLAGPCGTLLRGTRFIPVRASVRGLQRPAGASVPVRPVPRVVVVMGGTDPVGLAPKVAEALAATRLPLDVTVIATGERAEEVRRAAAGAPGLRVEAVAPVDDLPALMADSDLVVSAAGTSVWELCALGQPMALVCAVENQREGYGRVLAAGAAAGLGGPEEVADAEATGAVLGRLLTDPAERERLARAAHRLVDGLGAWRIVGAWEALAATRPADSAAGPAADSAADSAADRAADPAAGAAALAARPATLDDAALLHAWRNDPQTRASSRSSDEVPWEGHLAWLRGSLEREDRRLFVVSDAAGDVGTVRWDREAEGEWEVSITVAPARRGQGLSRGLLAAGEQALAHALDGGSLTAYLATVHEGNAASLRLFAGSGYLPDLPPDGDGFGRFVKPVGSLSPTSRSKESV